MVIAPLGTPMRSLALGLVIGDVKLILESTRTLLLGTVFSFAIALAIGLALHPALFESEVLGRTQASLNDLGVALAAGAIGGFARIRTGIGDALSGVAIAVALMPPLCTVALMTAVGQWSGAVGALLLYATNIVGITFACMAVYLLCGYGRNKEERTVPAWALSIAIVAVLAIPLTYTTSKILDAERLQASIADLVNRRDIFTNRVELVSTKADWSSKPVTVRVTVRTGRPLDVEAVRNAQMRLSNALHRQIHLVVLALPLDVIDPDPVRLPAPS
jgi:uncharacterized hydrophobic protein (TIGR00271 family)